MHGFVFPNHQVAWPIHIIDTRKGKQRCNTARVCASDDRRRNAVSRMPAAAARLAAECEGATVRTFLIYGTAHSLLQSACLQDARRTSLKYIILSPDYYDFFLWMPDTHVAL